MQFCNFWISSSTTSSSCCWIQNTQSHWEEKRGSAPPANQRSLLFNTFFSLLPDSLLFAAAWSFFSIVCESTTNGKNIKIKKEKHERKMCRLAQFCLLVKCSERLLGSWLAFLGLDEMKLSCKLSTGKLNINKKENFMISKFLFRSPKSSKN